MNSIQALKKEGKRTVEGSKNTALRETNLQNKMQSEPKEAPKKHRTAIMSREGGERKHTEE